MCAKHNQHTEKESKTKPKLEGHKNKNSSKSNKTKQQHKNPIKMRIRHRRQGENAQREEWEGAQYLKDTFGSAQCEDEPFVAREKANKRDAESCKSSLLSSFFFARAKET